MNMEEELIKEIEKLRLQRRILMAIISFLISVIVFWSIIEPFRI